MSRPESAFRSRAVAGGAELFSKVPQVSLFFWVLKILATTLGETGGDALSMSLNLGYAISTIIFLAYFSIALTAQVTSRRYRAFLYWATVVATTTVGTTTSDYLDRTVGLGYVKSSVLLFCAVLAVLALWRATMSSVRVDRVSNPRDEIFYWITILVSNTLGTALGDFVAATGGLGFEKGALLFASLIAVVALIHRFGRLPPSLLFWAAYVLTRPLGATLGDTLTKPAALGGLGLDRIAASLTIAVLMTIGIVLVRDRRRADR